MNAPFVGMMAGMAPAFAGYFGWFAALSLVAALGGTGWAAGRWVAGGGGVQEPRDAVTAEAERSAAPCTAHTLLRVSAVPQRTPRVR
ncbi:hypothetical protein ACWER6_03450 [Streptomyces sp. NPDC004009]